MGNRIEPGLLVMVYLWCTFSFRCALFYYAIVVIGPKFIMYNDELQKKRMVDDSR